MWQFGSLKNVKGQNNKKKGNQRALSLKRTAAQLKISHGLGNSETEIVPARVMLHEIKPKGVDLFSHKPLQVGQDISITIERPKQFFCRARIVGCQELSTDSNIITDTPYTYRMNIRFVFESPEQEQQVREYCQEMNRKYTVNPPNELPDAA